MKTSFPRLIARAAFFVALTFSATHLNAQIRGGSSERAIPTEIEKTDARVTQLIADAEARFKEGELNLKANEREQAREKFDRAVDTILESGINVTGYPRLQTYYLELVERIYRLEVPQQKSTSPVELAQTVQAKYTGQEQNQQSEPQQEAGFKQQKFEPSPLDELSKLILTPEEQNVDPEDVANIDVAKNALDFPIETNATIQQFINYFLGRGRSTMETGIRRSGQFMQMARKVFREEGVPEDIAWLAQVESGWRPKAMSPAAASGLWQFIPGTGQTYGLRQTAWIDERNGFEKATRASARYLKDLYNHFGDWQLAMAAYNTGQGNIDRGIARAGSKSYWKIFPYIAQETRNYVPSILATMLIAKNPEKYGFHSVRPDAPLTYDVVQVPSATNLSVIAQATNVSIDYIRMLNPELRRDTTPRGESYQVRIPAGKANQFVAALKGIPIEKRDAPANNVQLTGYTRAKADVSATPATPGLMKVKARQGDTPAKLAVRYNVSAEEVAKMNGTSVNAELPAGQEVKLPSPAPSSSRRRSGR
ncbi:MAG: rane-bound lytic murein transglycosylase [Acidobacteriota bacterium]|jgi:membrane-bound lytic murein transglycosylase D|nr:rane-bound lytic murein transglycosylase [Acidobacteriota bacterium]